MFFELVESKVQINSEDLGWKIYLDYRNRAFIRVAAVEGCLWLDIRDITGQISKKLKIPFKVNAVSIKFSNLDLFIAMLSSNNIIHILDCNSLSLDTNLLHAILKEDVADIISDFFWITDCILLVVFKVTLKWYSFEVSKKNNNFIIKVIGVEKIRSNNNWHLSCPLGSIGCSFRLLMAGGFLNRNIEVFTWSLQNMADKILKCQRKSFIIEGEHKLEDNDLIPLTIYQKHFLLYLNRTTMAYLYILENNIQLFCKIDLLNFEGRMATSVVDNLLIIHHQQSKRSMVLDILCNNKSDIIRSFEFLNGPNANSAVCRTILPVAVAIKDVTNKNYIFSTVSGNSEDSGCDILSPSWLFFQPNFIIETRLGVCWHLHLLIDNLSHEVLEYAKKDLSEQKCRLIIGFFSRRRDGKRPMLLKLSEIINDYIIRPIPDRLHFFRQIFSSLYEFSRLTTNLSKQLPKDSVIAQQFMLEHTDLFGALFAPILIRFHINYSNQSLSKLSINSQLQPVDPSIGHPNSSIKTVNPLDQMKRRMTGKIIETLIMIFISSFIKNIPPKVEQFVDDILFQILKDVDRSNQLNQFLYYGIGYSLSNEHNLSLMAFISNSLSIRFKMACHESVVNSRIKYEINDLVSQSNIIDAVNLALDHSFIDKKTADEFLEKYFNQTEITKTTKSI